MKEIIGKNGIAVTDIPASDSNGVRHRSYFIWKAMLSRCYSDAYQKRYPAYVGCSVHNDWLKYSKFKTWYDSTYNIHNGMKYQLDKDILVQGNKIYSDTTCCWVTGDINKLLSYKKINSTSMGITCYISSFRVRINDPITNKRLSYDVSDYAAAVQLYAEKKTEIIRKVADQAFYNNVITVDVRDGLYRWIV